MGGLHNDQGDLDVRDVESMMCRITHDCMVELAVEIILYANLLILPNQRIELIIKSGWDAVKVVGENEQEPKV